jgi:ubiquinone/menaquinone biosynthesis C-methylase UbiE
MGSMNEELRLLDEYKDRDARLPWKDWKINIYHPRHPLGNLFQQHIFGILVESLNRMDVDLSDMKILDVGCGYGNWLRYFVELGANPAKCMGVDLSHQRIDVARYKNPAIPYLQQNIDKLPFPDEHFDLVMQSFVFSSILDAQIRVSCASEMGRVLKKGGLLLWADLVKTETGNLVAFSGSEVRGYFPTMETVFHVPTHPRYFRRLHGKYAWLSRFIYHYTRLGCESQLMFLRETV